MADTTPATMKGSRDGLTVLADARLAFAMALAKDLGGFNNNIHEIGPYSKATRGNFPVTLSVA